MLLVAAVVAFGGVAACGGELGQQTSAPGLADSDSSLPGGGGFGQGPYTGPCYERPAAAVEVAWLPADLPLPEGSYPIEDLQDDGRFQRAVLAVPLTYGDFVQFVLAEWPDVGWILGRGESESGEAEDGFIRGDTYGAFRARRVYCEDGWSEILIAFGEADSSASTAPGTTG